MLNSSYMNDGWMNEFILFFNFSVSHLLTPWRGRVGGRECGRWKINFCEFEMNQRWLPYLQSNWRNVPAIIIFFLCSCIWWVLTHSVHMLRTERTSNWICYEYATKKMSIIFQTNFGCRPLSWHAVSKCHFNSTHWPLGLSTRNFSFSIKIFPKIQGINSFIVCIRTFKMISLQDSAQMQMNKSFADKDMAFWRWKHFTTTRTNLYVILTMTIARGWEHPQL